jgi:1-phosphofructokinase
MLAALDIPVALCGGFGGETGAVVRLLIEQSPIEVHAVDVDAGNVAYVHDRRTGSREAIAEMTVPALSRHDVDALYGVALTQALEGRVCVLAGAPEHVVPADTYERLARDIRTNGKTVVADLSGAQLRAALRGGLDVLKVSHDELVEDGWSRSERLDDLLAAVDDLGAHGSETVVLSRAEEPAIARLGAATLEVTAPHLTPIETRGTGDSMTAGIAAGIARGLAIAEAVKLGTAAGAMNVTRHGLASGDRRSIELLAKHIELRPLRARTDADVEPAPTASPDELAARARPRS